MWDLDKLVLPITKTLKIYGFVCSFPSEVELIPKIVVQHMLLLLHKLTGATQVQQP